MTALETLAGLRRRGVTFVAAGDRLEFFPASVVTPEEVEALRHHKAEILAALRAEPTVLVTTEELDREQVWHGEAEVVWRCEAMWRVLVRHDGRVRLQAKPGRHPHGACGSCGEPLPPAYVFTCLPCSRAAGLVRWVAWARGADRRAKGRAA